MAKVDDIKAAIAALPEHEFAELREWIAQKDWEEWDKQLQADSECGRLDFLVKEACDEKHEGRLRDL